MVERVVLLIVLDIGRCAGKEYARYAPTFKMPKTCGFTGFFKQRKEIVRDYKSTFWTDIGN